MVDRNSSGKDIDQATVKQAADGSDSVKTLRVLGADGQLKGRRLEARRPSEVVTKRTIDGVAGSWFSPLDPLVSSAPNDVKGRTWDFQPGQNITSNTQRLGQASYTELRNLARLCDLVTMAVETRKDQMEQYSIGFKLKDDRAGFKSSKDPRIKELMNFFAFPDRRRTTDRWIRKLMDDLLILDAPCVWIGRNRAGKPIEMRAIDTATIKPLIDEDGEMPLPPSPAFQQWLKGVPSGDYTADEMVWHPRNPRTDKLYGYSPVEQVYITVNTAIRRQLLILAGYTEGSIPEAIVPVPEGWTTDKIAEFQIYWDAVLSGQLGEQRKMRFVHNGMEKMVFTKKWDENGPFDEWLARVIMFAFSLPATPFIKQQTRTTADDQTQQAADSGLVVMVKYWREFFNLLIWKFWGYTDIETTFSREDTSNKLQDAQADQIRTNSGHVGIDELRTEKLGLPAVGQAPAVMTAMGLVLIGDAGKAEAAVNPAPDEGNGIDGDELLGQVAKLVKVAKKKKLRPTY